MEHFSTAKMKSPLIRFHNLPQEILDIIFSYMLHNSADPESTQTHSAQFTCKPNLPKQLGVIIPHELGKVLCEPCNFEKVFEAYPEIYEAFRAFRAQHFMFFVMVWQKHLEPLAEQRYELTTLNCQRDVPAVLQNNIRQIRYRRSIYESEQLSLEDLVRSRHFLAQLHSTSSPNNDKHTFPELRTLHLSGFDNQKYRGPFWEAPYHDLDQASYEPYEGRGSANFNVYESLMRLIIRASQTP
jgi:hypothetical protein